MHGLQRTHQCPCAPTQIQVAWARFPTPAVPEPPAVLAGSAPMVQVVHLARAQPVLRVLRVRLAVLERREPSAQVLLEHSEE